jgi:glycerol-3-phosphate dehydrogenase subunit B
MGNDLLIIGAGLSGLFAACLAARRGKKTLVIAQGIGGTHVSAGTIDVFNGSRQILTGKGKSSDHPYGLAGLKSLQAALDQFKILCAENGYPMHGEYGKNIALPTAAGGMRQACLVPETMIAGDLSRTEPFALAHLPGFRDFNAAFAISNLQSLISNSLVCAVNLSLPHFPAHRDSYATDLARLFDLPGYRDEVIAVWKPSLENAPKRLGLPAILGLDHAIEAKGHLESALGLELFEIPILPPSVPGMRLFNLLRDDFQNHGGQMILGLTARGEIANGRASVVAEMTGRQREYKADTVILATGGFLHGGLIAEFDGAIRESVFGLPVDNQSILSGAAAQAKDAAHPQPRSAWTSEHFLGQHPFAKFGVRVNKSMQPINANGKPIASNLRAVGSILAGADRLSEGSREGIELATAWRGIETVA